MAREQIDRVIAIDIGSSAAKAVAMSRQGDQSSCLGIKVIKFPHGVEQTEDALLETLKQIIDTFREITTNVALIASDRDLQLRFLTKPAMDRKTLDMVMRTEMKISDADDAVEQSGTAKYYSVVGEQQNENNREYHILSLTCPVTELHKREALIKKAGGRLVGMYPSSVALRECMMANYEDEIAGQPLPYLIAMLNFGADQNQIVVCDGGVLKLARSFPMAGEDLTRSIIGNYNTPDGAVELDRSAAEDYKTAVGMLSPQEALSYPEGALEVKISQMIERNFERMTQKMRLSLDYFKGQMKVQVARAFILGGGANMHGISEKLHDAIMVENISEFTPFRNIRYSPAAGQQDPPAEIMCALPGAVGCGICAFAADQSLNLINAIKKDYGKMARKMMVAAIPFVFAFLAALVLPAIYAWQFIYPEKIRIAQLKQEQSQLTGEFAQIETFKKQHDQLLKTKADWNIRSAFITRTINRRMFWSDLLVKLEEILPAEIWITQMTTGSMTVTDKPGARNAAPASTTSSTKVVLKGRSYSHQAVSQLVKSLEASSIFRNISWEGNVKDSDADVEEIQFSLTFTVHRPSLRKEREAKS